MHTQINIPTKSECGILSQRGSTNTFHKDKSKEEILGHRSVKTMMMYNYALSNGLAVKSPLD
ncbi:MAG TPA: hypothetical protein VMV32_06675 [Ignavibacteriaceae bacterium]|nr:hypothetical protein [Ignavibacteriaceae bacterium]